MVRKRVQAKTTAAVAPAAAAESEENDCEPSDWEVAIYAVSFAAIFCYAAADFYAAYGRPSPENLPLSSLKAGWLGEFMEHSTDNGESMLIKYWKSLIPLSAGFIFVSQVTLQLTPRTIHYLATAGYTLAVSMAVVNTRSAVYMLLLHTGAVCMGYFSLTGVWLLVLAAMALQTSNQTDALMQILNLHGGNSRSMYYPIVGYLYCRSISAGHSLHRMLQQQRMKGAEVPTLMQYLRAHLPRALAYGFYLPWHYCGPILTFDDFSEEVERPDRTVWDVRSALALIWRAFRLLLWLFLLQALHHFLPVGAFLDSIDADTSVPYKRLVFAMYLRGQNFMLVYIQLYGWPGLVARLDGVRLLHWPDCISRVYTYKKMWRVFDRGLASFMHHHIYIPMGGSRHGIVRQLTAVAASFAFVSIYHGDTWGIRVWSALNAVQLVMETAVCAVYRARVKNWLNMIISPWTRQRLVALVISINLFLSSCSIFIFFYHYSFKYFLAEVLNPLTLHGTFWYHLVTQYCAYCIVQISLRYERGFADKQRLD